LYLWKASSVLFITMAYNLHSFPPCVQLIGMKRKRSRQGRHSFPVF